MHPCQTAQGEYHSPTSLIHIIILNMISCKHSYHYLLVFKLQHDAGATHLLTCTSTCTCTHMSHVYADISSDSQRSNSELVTLLTSRIPTFSFPFRHFSPINTHQLNHVAVDVCKHGVSSSCPVTKVL